jgi:hypothetical protein
LFLGFGLGYVLWDEELLIGITCIVCLWAIKFSWKIGSGGEHVPNRYTESMLGRIVDSLVNLEFKQFDKSLRSLGKATEAEEGLVSHTNNNMGKYFTHAWNVI